MTAATDASTSTLTPERVLAAAGRLVTAFAATDTAGYFACFAPDATFVFHPERARLDSRDEYERLWDSWLASGWRVESCSSSNRLVQVYGDAAVLSHDVSTVTSTHGVEAAAYERESLFFRVVRGRVLAVHEHLSPAPSPSEESR